MYEERAENRPVSVGRAGRGAAGSRAHARIDSALGEKAFARGVSVAAFAVIL